MNRFYVVDGYDEDGTMVAGTLIISANIHNAEIIADILEIEADMFFIPDEDQDFNVLRDFELN